MKYILSLITLFICASCASNKPTSDSAYGLQKYIESNTPEGEISLYIDSQKKVGAIFYQKVYPFPHVFIVTITDKQGMIRRKNMEVWLRDDTDPYIFFELTDLENGTYDASIKYSVSANGSVSTKEYNSKIYL
jgi:hypothetical protein